MPSLQTIHPWRLNGMPCAINSPTSATSVQALSPLATSSVASLLVAARPKARPDMVPTGC